VVDAGDLADGEERDMFAGSSSQTTAYFAPVSPPAAITAAAVAAPNCCWENVQRSLYSSVERRRNSFVIVWTRARYVAGS